MSARRYVPLWWVPLLFGLTPAFGLLAAHRDLADFFLPMRTATATSLSAGVMPWLNLANGCGEAWFANPETAVLYPPAWLHLVTPPEWAMALEIALHLAWLSFGAGMLARRFGAGTIGRSIVEMAAWSVGPMAFSVGVFNNLETLAWVPWMVLAARVPGPRAIGLVAVTTTFGWLGGEPQLWAMAVALAVVSARSRALAAAGAVLGSLVAAFQMVPFVYWLLEGDRGPLAASWALRGATAPADWCGLLVPGLPVEPGRMVYMESLFFGAPLVVCGLLGAWRRKWLLAVAVLLGLLATLPELGGGDAFLMLTGGLVRYPSRFALAGLALLVPMIGAGCDAWLEGKGSWLAIMLASTTLGLCTIGWHPMRWWVAGVPALLVLAGAIFSGWRPVRLAALISGVVGTVIAALPLFGLQPVDSILGKPGPWPEASDWGRLYVPAPSAEPLQWLAGGIEQRRLWPVGYLNLTEGLTVARTDSPVANARLMHHLEIADRGPESRWWLDALSAPWVVLREVAGVPEDMHTVRVRSGMRLLRNTRAFPVARLDLDPPYPEASRHINGSIDDIVFEGNRFRATLVAVQEGFVWLSLAPVRGWRWSLDGARVELEQGPGIVQYLPVAAGRHELVGRYRPPGLAPAATVSVGAVIVVVALLWTSRRREKPIEDWRSVSR